MKTCKVIPITALTYNVYNPFMKETFVKGFKHRKDAELWIKKAYEAVQALGKAVNGPLIVRKELHT